MSGGSDGRMVSWKGPFKVLAVSLHRDWPVSSHRQLSRCLRGLDWQLELGQEGGPWEGSPDT